MGNQNNQENTTFNDQADGKFNHNVKEATLTKGVKADKEEKDEASDAESQVRATEDASLQDDSYSYDEANTDNEEYHDADDEGFALDDDDDFVQ